MPQYFFLPIERGKVAGGIFALPLPNDDAAIATARRIASGGRGCEAWVNDRLVIAAHDLNLPAASPIPGTTDRGQTQLLRKTNDPYPQNTNRAISSV